MNKICTTFFLNSSHILFYTDSTFYKFTFSFSGKIKILSTSFYGHTFLCIGNLSNTQKLFVPISGIIIPNPNQPSNSSFSAKSLVTAPKCSIVSHHVTPPQTLEVEKKKNMVF